MTDHRCPKFVSQRSCWYCPLPRAPDPQDMNETYVCSPERGSFMSCLHIGHLILDTGCCRRWAAMSCGSRPANATLATVFSVGSVGQRSTTGKARTRRGQNGDVTGEQDLRRIPGSSVAPRVPLHISRVSGPGHHQLSVIGCAIVTVSSIAVTL